MIVYALCVIDEKTGVFKIRAGKVVIPDFAHLVAVLYAYADFKITAHTFSWVVLSVSFPMRQTCPHCHL